MAFWLKRTGQENQAYSGPKHSMVIDHFSQTAMQNYCNYLGGKLKQSFGTDESYPVFVVFKTRLFQSFLMLLMLMSCWNVGISFLRYPYFNANRVGAL